MTTLAPERPDSAEPPERTIETKVPARLDRLPWSRFHWRIVFGLGTVWVLDGLEVTMVGSVASRLTEKGSGINISVAQVGTAAAFYIAGACLGALFFGKLTDRYGRKRLFMITLGIYLVSTALTALSPTFWFFWIFRFLTGTGIGGEYASINSAIDELIPARARGRVDLTINGSYWVGSALAAVVAIFFLNESIFPANVGWRLAFGLGVILGFGVLLVRRNVPESPRWMFIHGREEEAESLVDAIEKDVEHETGQELAPVERSIKVHPRDVIPLRWIVRTAFREYPRRSILVLALFIGQAFLYNGVVFNLGTLMTTFFKVSSGAVPYFIVAYAVGNFLGPLVLGRSFDTIGRKPMISATYLLSALFTLVLAILFAQSGVLNKWSFIAIIMVIFFIASAGASSAYLTASEIFPMETRALAIAVFYAIGTAVGGITGPFLFGRFIGSGNARLVALAFVIGAIVMALGGVAELFFGVKAEGAALEDIARPLTEVDEHEGGDGADEHEGGDGADGPVPGEHRTGARQARQRAAEERARAAELRAGAHDDLARSREGDEAAARRAEVEEQLADIADQVALAHDEYAVFHEELDAADRESDEALAAAARQRARAAEERAAAHEQDAQARSSEHEDEAHHHQALAAAALERAREREQRAMANEARHETEEPDPENRDAAESRRTMHELWASMHAERAKAYELRAEGDEDGARQAEQSAQSLDEEGRAAAFRVEAAERRADAHQQEEEETQAQERGRREEEEARRRATEERIRARLNRRNDYERAGLRRYRPGPGRLSSFPGIGSPTPLPEEALDSQIESLQRAVADHGPVERRELARLVGARYWGPGVFSEALRQATNEGALRRVSRSVYGPPAGADEHAGTPR